jgi:hypothetical protein
MREEKRTCEPERTGEESVAGCPGCNVKYNCTCIAVHTFKILTTSEELYKTDESDRQNTKTVQTALTKNAICNKQAALTKNRNL